MLNVVVYVSRFTFFQLPYALDMKIDYCEKEKATFIKPDQSHRLLLHTTLLLLSCDRVTEVNPLKSLPKDATRQTVTLQFITCLSIV